ncbi:threonine synthase [Modestobacter sp. L9-4]|uniref:threonine synthase n=1 Tax=Modestobacter sp. L9-4 TaxID=2851567 RepID=UPI001C790E6C|nr:threonine synthase [Modestobacter sp. L9-4]QXG74867.1 threonine synthase [Modestobacter sp. L9-4]
MTMTAPGSAQADVTEGGPVPLNPARGLICRNCGATFGLIAEHACAECFGPLEVDYDKDLMRAVTRQQIEAGPQNIWRYVALLPVGHDPASRVTLDPGMTPLVKADRLAAELGLTAGLWVKDDSANPTHSFKDRVVSLAATAAKTFGYAKIACASTGNLANSVAAHAARMGLPSFVFVPSDLEPGKITQSAVYGQALIAVDGNYDDVNRLTSELAETDEFEDTAFVNQNVRPYYAEGSKTMGYEIAEQLGWRIPAQVVIPMASGSLLTKVDKAWRELVAAGIVEDTEWTIFGAQSAGCDPIATAFDNGWDVVKPVKPTGIAKSLNIGNPADGPYALDAIRRTGGSVGRVGDDEIVQGIRDLARTTGVFAETAGGVTVAVLRQLVEKGLLDPAKETVVLNTGEGLKTLDPLLPVVGPTHHVQPSLRSLREAGLIA